MKRTARQILYLEIPSKFSYPILAAVLGFAVPLGALLQRVYYSTALSSTSVRLELAASGEVYSYMFVTAPVIFGVFGFTIGYFKDKVVHQKAMLETLNNILENKSITDALTGTYNYGHLMELVDREIERAVRYQRIISGMMVDIDNFKDINDTFGHVAGDYVIRTVSQRLRECLRRIDILGRYGGDEFFVIMPEAMPDGALELAQRILREVQKWRFVWKKQEIAVSVSLGLCSFANLADIDRLAFIDKADQALLESKRKGKHSFIHKIS